MAWDLFSSAAPSAPASPSPTSGPSSWNLFGAAPSVPATPATALAPAPASTSVLSGLFGKLDTVVSSLKGEAADAWNDIKSGVQAKVPVIPSKIAPSYSSPSTPPVPFDDTVAGILENTVKAIPSSTLRVAQQIGQGAMRAYSAVGTGLTHQEPLAPSTPFQQALYGTDRPITLQSVGRETRLANPESRSTGGFKVLDPVIGLISGTADVLGLGGERDVVDGSMIPRAVLSFLADEKDADRIQKTLTGILKVPEKDAASLSGALAEAGTVEQVKDVLTNHDRLAGSPDAAKVVPNEMQEDASLNPSESFPQKREAEAMTHEDAVKSIVADALRDEPAVTAKARVNGKVSSSRATPAPSESALAAEAMKYDTPEEFTRSLGTPSFHGTNGIFEKFDQSRISGDEYGPGINFTDDATRAAKYGSTVKEAYLDIKNPFKLNDPIPQSSVRVLSAALGKDASGFEGKILLDRLQAAYPKEQVQAILRNAGFDGTQFNFPDGKKVQVAFSPDQIITKEQALGIYDKVHGLSTQSTGRSVDAGGNPINNDGYGTHEGNKRLNREDSRGAFDIGRESGTGIQVDSASALSRDTARLSGLVGEGNRQSTGPDRLETARQHERAQGELEALHAGNAVKVSDVTPTVLRAIGAPQELVTAIPNYVNRGAISHVGFLIGEEYRNTVGGYVAGMLQINPERIDHELYRNGELMFHELDGHSFYDKSSRDARNDYFRAMKTDPSMIKKAWVDSKGHYQFYWNQTYAEIHKHVRNSVMEQTGITDYGKQKAFSKAENILSRAGMEQEVPSLDEFIRKSLTIDESIDDINRELVKEGYRAIYATAPEMFTTNEHFAVMSERADSLSSTSELLQDHIEKTRTGTTRFRNMSTMQKIKKYVLRKELTPREILAKAEGDAASPSQQDRVNGLKEVVEYSRNYNAYMKTITNDPAYRDILPQLDKDVRDAGYENLTAFYQANKAVPEGVKPEEIPEQSMKSAGDIIKKINVTSREVPMSTENRETLDQIKAQRSVLQDMVDDHPGKTLQKFVSKKEGVFEDFKDPMSAKNPGQRKFIEDRNRAIVDAAESAFEGTPYGGQFDNPDVIRSAISDFRDLSSQLEETKQDQRDFVKSERAERNVLKDERALDKQARRKSVKEMPESVSAVTPPEVRGGIRSPRLQLDKWKDKDMLMLNRDTFERNIEKVAPKSDADKLKRFIVDPVRANETARIKFNNDMRTQTLSKMKELGIARNTSSDELIQRFGEGEISLAELQKASPKKWGEIQRASDYFRKTYDSLIDKWNEVRRHYGFPDVPKRPDYFRHFDEVNFFTRTYGLLSSKTELPSSIAGKTEFFKPGKPFSTAELKRTGKSTKYSAIGGMNNYLDSVSKQIYHIDSIQRGRALERYMENSAKVGEALGTPLGISNVITNVREYVNNGLAGKTASLDRTIENSIGRNKIAAFHSISKLIGKNIIVGNVSTALSHLVSLPLIGATTDKIPLTKGLMTTLTSPLTKDGFKTVDGIESAFLTRRFSIDDIMRSWPKKAEDALSYLFAATDKFKSRLAVSGKYYEGLSKGLSREEAMDQADTYAARVIGDNSLGQKPNLMNAKVTSLLAQFQLGLNDSISVLTHDIPYQDRKYTTDGKTGEEKSAASKWKVASKLIQFALYAYLFNLVLKQIRGSGKGLDPIDLGLTLAGMNDEGTGQTVPRRIGLASADVLGELPFSSAFTGNFPLATAIGDPVSDLMSGNYKSAAETVAADFLSPVGGGLQAQKTIEGESALSRGEADTNAKKAQAIVFGPAAISDDVVSNTLDKGIKTYQTKLDSYDPSSLRNAQDAFDAASAAGFGTDAADQAVSGLSDNEYAIYGTIKSQYLDRQAKDMESEVLPIVKKADALGFGSDEADRMVQGLTDRQYDSYTRIKKALYGASQDNGGDSSQSDTASDLGPSTSEKAYDQHSLVNHVWEAAKALGTDPRQTFDDLFAGNSSYRIAGVKGGQVIVVRAPEKVTDAIKKKFNALGSKYILDHTIPLTGGGNNGNDNLVILPRGDADTPGTWAWNTPNEVLIGNALDDGKITGEQAREYAIRLKMTAGEPLSPAFQKEFREKYGSEPLTPDQLQELVR